MKLVQPRLNPPEEPIDTRVFVTLKFLVSLRGKAKGFSFLPRQPVGSALIGKKLSKLRGRGLDFLELKHYQVGDDLRYMDWKITNRTGTPYVRTYSEEKDRPLFVLVDQRSSMFFGSTEKLKSVIACELAALAVWRAIDVGDRAGLIILTDEDVFLYPPTRNVSKIKRYLGQLVVANQNLKNVNTERGVVTFATVLDKLAVIIQHDSLIIILSDFIDFDSTVTKSLARIMKHNDGIAGLIVEPLDYDITALNNVIVGDGNKQARINLTTAENKLFQTKQRNQLTSCQGILTKFGISQLLFNTHEQSDLQIRRMIGKRRLTS